MDHPSLYPLSERTEANGWLASRFAGVRYRSLRYDRATRAGAVLIEMAPDTTYGEHRHIEGEDVLVLEGGLVVGSRTLAAGEHLYSPPGSVHEPRTIEGCLLFATFPGRIEHL